MRSRGVSNDGRSRVRRPRQVPIAYTLFTNSGFNPVVPIPSILRSMSWSASARRMYFTLVLTLTTRDESLTYRSLSDVTVSPSCGTLPLAGSIARATTAAGTARPDTRLGNE